MFLVVASGASQFSVCSSHVKLGACFNLTWDFYVQAKIVGKFVQVATRSKCAIFRKATRY